MDVLVGRLLLGRPCLACLAASPKLSWPASEASPESAPASSWAVSSSFMVARLHQPRIASHQNTSEPNAPDRIQTDGIYTLRKPNEEDHRPQPWFSQFYLLGDCRYQPRSMGDRLEYQSPPPVAPPPQVAPPPSCVGTAGTLARAALKAIRPRVRP